MVTTGAPLRDIGSPDLFWGTWGQGLLTEWWETSADLIWPNSVITYGRMRHDPQLRAVLSAYLLPLIRATWMVDPAGCRDEVVQRVADDLGIAVKGTDTPPGPARRRGVIWQRHLRDALKYLTFGHAAFELRYRLDGNDLRLDNLGARMPWTIAQIRMNPDASIAEVVQTTQNEPIPGNRVIWYANDQEGANWAGTSILRPAYGAWLLKHETWRVNATSIRRFGMGVPSVEAPVGATAQMVEQARDLAAAMRVGDQSGVGLPSGFKVALTGLTGSVPDALGFIKYLDQQMSKMVLAGLIDLGQTETGSRALGQSFLDLFLLSLQTVADDVAVTATSGHMGGAMPGIVTDLVDLNWGEDEPAPRVLCADIGVNYELTAEAVFRLVQCGALAPDPALDIALRERWNLPERTTPWEPTSKGIPAPGAPVDPNAPGGEDVTPTAPAPAKPTPPAPAPKASGRLRAAAPAGLRRQLTAIEAKSGFAPLDHQAEWSAAVDGVLAAYMAVVRAQRTSLIDQVTAAVEAGKIAGLALLKASAKDGATILADAMAKLADTSALRMVVEAETQGVAIDIGKARIDQAKLSTVATARATMAAGNLAHLAGTKALSVVQAAKKDRKAQAAEVADLVDVFLSGVSPTPLRDQIGAALSVAQMAGRVAVLEAAPASAGAADYVASEVLDANTCGPCLDEDGHVFGSLADAEGAYPSGGFLECEGFLRCRGTVVAVWEGG
jgi:hypothetical protein